MLGTSEFVICRVCLWLHMLSALSCMWPVPGGGRGEKGAAIFVPVVVYDGCFVA